MVLVALLYLLFASTFTLAKAAVAYMPPILFVGIRMVIAGTLLLSYVFWRRPHEWRFERRHSKLFAGIILLHIYAAYVFEFVALPCITSFKASLLYSISPFLTALVAFMFFKERMSKQKWLGLTIGFIGLLPIILEQAVCGRFSGTLLSFVAAPELLLFIAIFSSVCGWIFMKNLVTKGYSPIMVNGVGMLGGGVLALLTSFLVEGTPHLYQRADHGTTIASINFSAHGVDMLMVTLIMGLLILIANVISYNFYGYLLKRYSATFLSFAGFMCPLFTALFGWLFLHEKVSINFFISSAIVISGLYIFYRQEFVRKA